MRLERRYRRWYACLDIPTAARAAVGKKAFVQSLGTEDKTEAKARAGLLAIKWQAEIADALAPVTEQGAAEWWRGVLKGSGPEERSLAFDQLADQLRSLVDTAATRAGIEHHQDPAYSELPEYGHAEAFLAVATGALVPFSENLDAFIASTSLEPRTLEGIRSVVKRFVDKGFTNTKDVTRKRTQAWLDAKVKEDGLKPKTMVRELSFLRGYWRYLTANEIVSSEMPSPFIGLSMPRVNGKAAVADKRQPFSPAAVVKLHGEALKRGDQPLADLIELDMYSGARIAELAALKVDKVNLADKWFEIVDAKSPAGWRVVPIHSKLIPTFTRLCRDSKDAYVLSGLLANKFGDRSNAIGKRFSDLKTLLGYGAPHVFHSIRKTVSTLFENAGVAEGTAADIIGHEKKTITYGLYSSGASLETKRLAIEKLSYPWGEI
jgi:integrase